MKRGSITLQLCLVLGLILSLVLYSIRSVRIAEGRVLLSCAGEQSLYSLFAQYDRDLYEDYGLLFLDGGYSGRDLKPGELCRELLEAAEYITDPGKGRILPGRTLSGLELSDCELTGFQLATDLEGAAFRRQVCREMKGSLGVRALETLREKLDQQLQITREQEDYWEASDPEGTLKAYETMKAGQADPEASSVPAAAAVFRADPVKAVLTAEEEPVSPEAPEDFENPIETVLNLRRLGILSAAVPEDPGLSGAEADTGDMVSGRLLQKGMGMLREAEDGLADRVLLMEYLLENFPCYTSRDSGEGLKYQVEYAIGGKDKDVDNLKSVLTKLLLIREASNFIFLMKDSEKSAEADRTAMILSTLLRVPQMKDLVSLLLKMCWAYGESIMDLRALLAGGKIPLIKDRDSWQLSLGSLAGMLFGLEGQARSSEEGLNYTWYLRLLLCMESSSHLTEALMDLTEYNVRLRKGRPDFSLDSCVESLEIRLTGRVDGQELFLTRSYGYDMED